MNPFRFRNISMKPILTLVLGIFAISLTGIAQSQPTDSLLVSYLLEAWKTHPDLRSMREMVVAESSRTAMSRAWMNPELRAGLMNVPENFDLHMDPATMWQIGIMQQIPFPGKLNASSKAGEARTQAAVANLENVRNQMSAMVAMSYYELAAAITTRHVLEHGRDLTQQIIDAAAAKIESSTGSQSDLLRARLELEQWNNRLVSNTATIETKRANLAFAIGRSDVSTLQNPILPDSLPTGLVPLNESDPSLITSSPGIRRIKYETTASELDSKRAMLEYWPDVTVGLTYGIRGYLNTSSTDGMTGVTTSGKVKQDNMVSIELSTPIPVFYRNNQRAKVSELLAMKQSKNDEYARSVLAKQQELRTIAAQWKEKVELLQINQITIQKADAAWRASLTDYLTGSIPFMNLTEARMNLVMAQMESIMLRADGWGVYWRWQAALGSAYQPAQETK